jgi:hypothetical protein
LLIRGGKKEKMIVFWYGGSMSLKTELGRIEYTTW